MESAFSETQCAAELLQQFGGFIFSHSPLPSVIYAMRHTCSCPAALLTNTAFASSLVRSASLHCATSPVSIISGDGYSIFKVQCRTNIFLTFALPCITLNPYLDIVFKDFVPVHKDEI